MISEKEFKAVVFQLGELAHSEDNLLDEVIENFRFVQLVQDKLGITEAELRRDDFEVIEGGRCKDGEKI